MINLSDTISGNTTSHSWDVNSNRGSCTMQIRVRIGARVCVLSQNAKPTESTSTHTKHQDETTNQTTLTKTQPNQR